MKNRTILLSAIVASTAGVQAATLATYIDGADYADSNTPAASSDAQITTSDMSFVGISGGFGGPVRNVFGDINVGGGVTTDYWYVVNANQDPNSDPGAGSALTTDYYGFTVTVDAANSIDATTLTFDWGIGSNDNALTGATFGQRVFASVDGGAFTSVGLTSITTDVPLDTWVDQTSVTIDLTSLANTADGGNIEFRIQQFTSETGGGVMAGYSNFQINGDIVATPEPSSAALLGLGSLALIMRRRK